MTAIGFQASGSRPSLLAALPPAHPDARYLVVNECYRVILRVASTGTGSPELLRMRMCKEAVLEQAK